MKSFYCLIVILFSNCQIINCQTINEKLDNLKCSDYHINYNKAKQLFSERSIDFKEIDSLINIALLSNKKPFSVDLYFSLKFFSKSCNEESFIDVSKRLLDNGVNKKIIFKQISSCFNKKKIKEELNTYFQQVVNKNNIAKVLNKIYKDDKWSQLFFVSDKKRVKINNINFKRLIDIIKVTNKWPGITTSNQDLNIYHVDISYDFTQSLLHFSIEQVEILLPYLQKAVFEQEISQYHYARIYDYYYFKKNTIEELVKNKNDVNQKYNQKKEFILYSYYGVYKYNKTNNNGLYKMGDYLNHRKKLCMIDSDIFLE